jgi:hypothetical protein
MNEAQTLIESATYDSGTVALLGQAFDEAWASLAATYDAAAKEAARSRLAEVILTLASAGHREVAVLKRLAGIAMALGRNTHAID